MGLFFPGWYTLDTSNILIFKLISRVLCGLNFEHIYVLYITTGASISLFIYMGQIISLANANLLIIIAIFVFVKCTVFGISQVPTTFRVQQPFIEYPE